MEPKPHPFLRKGGGESETESWRLIEVAPCEDLAFEELYVLSCARSLRGGTGGGVADLCLLKDAPQCLQKRASLSVFFPHEGHFIAGELFLGKVDVVGLSTA